MSVQNILSSLKKVRKTGKSRWVACCPAHPDKSPSLSVADADGTILLHCFGGCEASAVMGALGIEPSDLFPEREQSKQSGKPSFRRLRSDELLGHLHHDLNLIVVFGRMLQSGETPAESDFNALGTVIDRIQDGLAYGGVR